jgi:hypothetical protein
MNKLMRQFFRMAAPALGFSVWLAAIDMVIAGTIETRPPAKSANPPATQSPLNQPVYPGTTAAGANVAPVPLPLKDLRVQQYVAGGNNAVGTVELTQALPYVQGAGGLNVAVPTTNVTLQSSNPDLVHVPAQVAVTHGSSVNFTMRTRPMAENTRVTITARLGVQAKEATLTIFPPWVQSVHFNPPSDCRGEGKLDFTLAGPAPPGGLTVSTRVNIWWSYQTSSGATASGSGSDGKAVTVASGDRSGSARLHIYCQPSYPVRCSLNGYAVFHNPQYGWTNAPPGLPPANNHFNRGCTGPQN